MITIPDAMRRPAEVERDELKKQLAEARAEIDGAIKLCGEYATNASEGLYASLAISVGRLADAHTEARATAVELGEQKQTLNKMIDHNEKELDAARAEIERLNKNMRFATAINSAMQEAGQDLPDLRGHECLAKHKLLSLFDFWRKKVRPRLPGLIDDGISQRDKLIEQMREALDHCKNTFNDYVKIHKMKIPTVAIGPIPPKWNDIQRKIARNQESADLCAAALSAAERGEG